MIADSVRSIAIEDVALLRQGNCLFVTCYDEAMHIVVQLLPHLKSSLYATESGCRMVAHCEGEIQDAVGSLLLMSPCGGLLEQHSYRAKCVAIDITCTQRVAVKLILGEVLRSNAVERSHIIRRDLLRQVFVLLWNKGIITHGISRL